MFHVNILSAWSSGHLFPPIYTQRRPWTSGAKTMLPKWRNNKPSVKSIQSTGGDFQQSSTWKETWRLQADGDWVFMCLSLSVWEKTSAPLLHKHAHSLQEEEKTRFKVGMCWMTNFPALLLFSFVSQLLWSPRSCERSLHLCLFHGYPVTFINATHLDSDSMDFLF